MKRNRLVTALALAASLALPSLSPAATGGPDAKGYTWADSDEPGVDTSIPFYTQNDLRALGFTGDDKVLKITLPTSIFPTGFPFYGTFYPEFWISSNGWISFVDPVNNSYPVAADVFNPALPNTLFPFYWDDWTLEGSAPFDDGGPNANNDGYTMFIRLFPKNDPNTLSQFFITLYKTGVIKVYYSNDVVKMAGPRLSIGVEDQGGNAGLPFMKSGAPQGSANFRSDYAVVFYPKKQLDCSANVTPLTCGQAAMPYSNATGSNAVSSYNCSTGSYLGNEKIFSFTLTKSQNVTVTLNNTDAKSREVFIMKPSCNEFLGCIANGTTTTTAKFLPAGTYYVVVDGVGAADNGNFTLALQCSDAARTVTCGTQLTAQVTAGPSGLTQWSCAGPFSGPENVYSVDVNGPATLRAAITNKTNPDMAVLISNAAGFDANSPSCLKVDPDKATVWGATTGTYYVAVDGQNGAAGQYDINITCDKKLSCPTPPKTIIVTTPVVTNGDTTVTGQANVDSYYCTNSAYNVAPLETTGYTGPEDVYEFTITAPSMVSFLFNPSNPDMRLLIMGGSCYEGACIMEGGCGENLAVGTYRLVVDGLNGASGKYAFTPFVFPTVNYNRWYQCPRESPTTGQDPSTIRLKDWGFNSGTFCDNGCAEFSLFAVVECGQVFHIPFKDVETGRMKIYDVFQQQYVTLKATNELPANTGKGHCPYTVTGTYVEWLDRGCPSGGNDCISNVPSNDLIMDVSFQGTPNTCGIFKLEFQRWGGFVWDVYANCRGDSDANNGFYLYRDLCSAIANYNPLPELGIEAVDIDNSQCGSLTASGTMTLVNVGCLPADQMEIVIDEVPSAGAPKTIKLNLVNKGERVVVPWSFNLSGRPRPLSFKVDPALPGFPSGKTIECSENLGNNVSCGASGSLRRDFPAIACPGQCITGADAGPSASICFGDGVRLDGKASSFSCLSGSKQYRWEYPAGTVIPGCDWSATATCDVPPGFLPAGTDLVTLKTQCVNDNPPCVSTASTVVDVIDNIAPPGIGNTLRSYRDGDHVRMSWAALLGSPISGYRVYKDDDKRLCSGVATPFPSCAAATRVRNQDLGFGATSGADINAIPSPPTPVAFYQIIGISCRGDIEGPY